MSTFKYGAPVDAVLTTIVVHHPRLDEDNWLALAFACLDQAGLTVELNCKIQRLATQDAEGQS